MFDIEKHVDLSKDERSKLAKIKKYEKYMWLVNVKTMKSGDSFGELALVNNSPRAATIKCETDCSFAVIHKPDYDNFIKKLHNKMTQKDINFFNKLPIFKHWTTNQIRKLVLGFKYEKFQRNQAVYKQGEPANMVYIAQNGDFETVRQITSYKIENDSLDNNIDFKKYIGPNIKKNNYSVNRMRKDLVPKHEQVKVALINQGRIFGIEDV